MKSETEYKTKKNGDVDVYKATTRVTFTEGELEEAIKLYAEMLQDEIERQMPWFNREFLAKVMI